MHRDKRKRILKNHIHSMEVLNLLRQQKIIEHSNELIAKMFTRGSWTKEILSMKETDVDFKCSLKFEDLGITRREIAHELVKHNCLPGRFFELTIYDDPKVKKLKKEIDVLIDWV